MTQHSPIVSLITFLIIVTFYFIPTIMACFRKHPNSTAIFVTDMFLGWTCIGWIVALIWASTNVKRD